MDPGDAWGFDPIAQSDARNLHTTNPKYTQSMRRLRLPQPRLSIPESVLSTGASLLTVLWGGFWIWFALMHILDGENTAADLVPMLLFATPVLILSLLALIFPRIGGLLMIPAAMFGAWFFDDAGARMLLATPALVLGATLVWLGPWKRQSLARRVKPPRRRSGNA